MKEKKKELRKKMKKVKTDDRLVENMQVEEDAEPSIELLDKIKKQVEFYFGDVNMQRDKFLIKQTRLDGRWVPMTDMMSFKILASLSKNTEIILKALEKSELMEVSEDRTCIRRSLDKPLPMYNVDYIKAQKDRTVYLKGFPTETMLESLKSYFEFTDAIELITMRKQLKKEECFFKGSIFLQFQTLNDAKAFMEQKSVKYKDKELIKLWLSDYVALKETKSKESCSIKANDPNNLKTDDNLNDVAKSKSKKSNIRNKNKLPKGCVFHITNVHEDITRDQVENKLNKLRIKIAYIDYNSGDIEGWIRVLDKNFAINLLKKLDLNLIKIKCYNVTFKLLDGDEEENYLSKIQENRQAMKRRHTQQRQKCKKLITDDF